MLYGYCEYGLGVGKYPESLFKINMEVTLELDAADETVNDIGCTCHLI